MRSSGLPHYPDNIHGNKNISNKHQFVIFEERNNLNNLQKSLLSTFLLAGRNKIFPNLFYLYISGFGTSTPKTSAGRFLTIGYGVLGCTCCILFFNLFLERFVTALSYLLRCDIRSLSSDLELNHISKFLRNLFLR